MELIKLPKPQFITHEETLRAYGGLHYEHVRGSEHLLHGHGHAVHEAIVLLLNATVCE